MDSENTSPTATNTNTNVAENTKITKITPTNIILQVLGGVMVSIIIYWISLFAINRDKLVITNTYNSSKKPSSYALVRGYIECVSAKNIVFNTSNQQSRTYTPLPRSVNRMGGAQFSYSFWLFMDDVSNENVQNKIILCRGDMQKYNYSLVDKASGSVIESGKDTIIKCPLIRFGSNYKEIVIEFNTTDSFNEKMTIINKVSDDNSALRRNIMSLTPNYWVMFTIVFEDNVPINDFENGVAVKFYLNDTLYQIHKVKSMIRQNNGDIYILPDDQGIKSARICDVYYHNYAIDDIVIRNMYQKGPTKVVYTRNNDFGVPLYLSASNKIDQSNL